MLLEILCEGKGEIGNIMVRRSIKLLSERKINGHHVSYNTIAGLEKEFEQNSDVEVVCISPISAFINRCLKKIKLNKCLLSTPPYFIDKESIYFYAAMGKHYLTDNRGLLKRIARRGTLAIYLFDTWEPEYDTIISLLKDIGPKYIFFAYHQTAEALRTQFNRVYVLPQSMDREYFHSYKVSKTRLFMQMGRRNERIHNLIISYLKEKGIAETDENYVYEKQKGHIIYPSIQDLAINIAKTKYFVAAPKILESMDSTGNISDVTARFYEAMACKTLIIGYKPKYFSVLFPDAYMIDLDEDERSFGEIIDYYEEHMDEYDEIVDRNYNVVFKHHTWTNRLQTVFDSISS